MNIDLEESLEEVKIIANLLFRRNWAEKSAGNFSLRLEKNDGWVHQPTIFFKTTFPHLINQRFLIKSSNAQMRDIAVDPTKGIGILSISPFGDSAYYKPLKESSNYKKPSSEFLSHLIIHNYLLSERPSLTCVLHTHPLEMIVFSHLMKGKAKEEVNNILLSMHVEIPLLFPKGIGIVPDLEPGSMDLAIASLKNLEEHSVLLWENHGCLCTGKSINDAYDSIDVINKGCSIYIKLREAGWEKKNE